MSVGARYGRAARWRIALLLLAVVAALWATAPARAAEGAASDWFVTEQGRVRLVAATPFTGDAESVQLGLEFRLAPHWKVYWRSPGDAGFPPRLDWTGSQNLAGADMTWPAPRRFSVLGLETVGYEDGVVFPIAARLAHPGALLHLRLALSYLTCSEICIPYDTTLTLDLPAVAPGLAGPSYAPLIARWAARVPQQGGASGIEIAGAAFLPGKQPTLEIRVRSATPLENPDAFVEGPAGVVFGKPRLDAGEPGDAVLRLPVSGDPAMIGRLVGQKLTVTLADGARSAESAVVPAMGQPAVERGAMLPMLALALLGGFILNFMPCVLPVLSLKLLSVVGQAGRTRRELRWGFLATAAGVLLSFLALALAMIGLKSAGVAVGWGLQFQQPLFLVFMAALLILFAANLWGLFEVPLPAAVAGIGARGPNRGLLGNLATGAFATLLATPCSAPFLGTAVGFALAAGPVEILGIFLALGVGLAAPYLLVAAVPGLARALPRPGRWMVALRRLLALALAAAAAWLISVLTGQIGLGGALAVAALLGVMVLALLLLRAATPRGAVLGVALAAALVVPFVVPPPPARAVAQGVWQPFDRAAIAKLVAERRVVFVDVTAQWCINCQVNERLVLDAAPVRDRLRAPGVVAMRADWTRPDAAIADYLRSFGRYGIPFNAVYGPGAPQGLPLPEILTADHVTAALARAAGEAPRLGAAR